MKIKKYTIRKLIKEAIDEMALASYDFIDKEEEDEKESDEDSGDSSDPDHYEKLKSDRTRLSHEKKLTRWLKDDDAVPGKSRARQVLGKSNVTIRVTNKDVFDFCEEIEQATGENSHTAAVNRSNSYFYLTDNICNHLNIDCKNLETDTIIISGTSDDINNKFTPWRMFHAMFDTINNDDESYEYPFEHSIDKIEDAMYILDESIEDDHLDFYSSSNHGSFKMSLGFYNSQAKGRKFTKETIGPLDGTEAFWELCVSALLYPSRGPMWNKPSNMTEEDYNTVISTCREMANKLRQIMPGKLWLIDT